MNLVKKSISFIFVSLLINSCKTIINENIILNESQEDIKEDLNSKKNQIEIRFSCGENNIKKYLNDGWIIIKEYSEEKVCTWKSFPSTKGCNMEKDKGCKITKPDKIGEEKIYFLRR